MVPLFRDEALYKNLNLFILYLFLSQTLCSLGERKIRKKENLVILQIKQREKQMRNSL